MKPEGLFPKKPPSLAAFFFYAGTSSTRIFSAMAIVATAPKTALTGAVNFPHGENPSGCQDDHRGVPRWFW
jgi:hypothetical protein